MKSSSCRLLAFAAAASVSLFAVAGRAAAAEAALSLVSPTNGEALCLLNDGMRRFAETDAPARRAIFTDKTWRREAATKWRSRPLPVRLEWRGGKPGKVRVAVRKKGDAAPWFCEETEGSRTEVWNLEIAREYEWSVDDGENVARGTFRTMDIPPRAMSVKGVPNFRDLGGWRAAGGRRVRQGLVYRSQGLNDNARYFLTSDETMALYRAGRLEELYGKTGADIKARIDRDGGKADFDPNAPWMRKSLPRKDPKPPLPRLDEAAKAYLAGTLGIKTDIDLRGDTEVWGMTESPLGPCANWLWIPCQAYGGIASAEGRAAFAKVFRAFLDKSNYPIVFHCIGGADRTGCVAWVLNGLLGVAEDDLMKDWEITCFEYESQSFGHGSRIDRFLGLLGKEDGATMREKCESLVKSLGFTQSDIDAFRSIMLEPDKAPLKVLMIGNSFTGSVMRETPNLAKAEGLKLDIVQCGIGGCPLDRHWANVERACDRDFKPYGISASFASGRTRNFPRKANVTDMLAAEKWDIVTIQQASGKSAFYDTYQPYADMLIAKIRELAPQAEIVVQETWSYSPYDKRLAQWKMTPKEMHGALKKAYAQLAGKHGLRTIPTGDAVQLFRDRFPVEYGTLLTQAEIDALRQPATIDFHGDVAGSSAWKQGRKGRENGWEEVRLRNDFPHLNARGHYLQACVWTGFLFGVDPATFAYRPESLPESDAKLMRECARDALEASRRQSAKTTTR